jgi:Co/Zn/Cd efflux system component
MFKTTFIIPQMDCPSEENLIRLGLDGVEGIRHLDFDIPARQLRVFHSGDPKPIEHAILQLNLGSQLVQTEPAEPPKTERETDQRTLLWTVLGINFAFFVIEMASGLLSRSMGLVADSLDMLADAFVYGISLSAVNGTISRKKRIARLAGYFQLSLAVLGFLEVLRRFFGTEKMPDYSTMIIVSAMALPANALCLYLLQRSKSKEESHMQASLIFTSNDVIANAGVILAGGLVYWLGSNLPDLLIGAAVFVLVVRGGWRILQLGKSG